MMLSVVGELSVCVRKANHEQQQQHCVLGQLIIGFYISSLAYFSLVLFIEPITTIIGSPDLYIDTGSTINLTCVVKHLPEPPPAIYWTHNSAVNINFIAISSSKQAFLFLFLFFHTSGDKLRFAKRRC